MAHTNHCFTEQLETNFLFWKHLHGFWQTLPNFNLYTASLEPGQNLAADALALIQGKGKDNDDEDEDGAFGANNAQIGTDNDEGDGSAKQSDEQVCPRCHPLHQLQQCWWSAGNS